MTAMKDKIAAGLELAFAKHGFAETDIETLRDSADVSLRTLYKYFPTRDDRMLAALEHRHRRYLAQIAADLPDRPEAALSAFFDRIGAWMDQEASHGCLFHAAVAAAPGNAALRAMLARHKREVSEALAAAIGRYDVIEDLTLLIEGLTQSWPLHGQQTVQSAKRLAAPLLDRPYDR
jgi:AcrR family transcriptional regulator